MRALGTGVARSKPSCGTPPFGCSAPSEEAEQSVNTSLGPRNRLKTSRRPCAPCNLRRLKARDYPSDGFPIARSCERPNPGCGLAVVNHTMCKPNSECDPAAVGGMQTSIPAQCVRPSLHLLNAEPAVPHSTGESVATSTRIGSSTDLVCGRSWHVTSL